MQTGSVTVPYFHYIFKPTGEITHFNREIPIGLALSRKYLYLISIAETTPTGSIQVIGGVFVFTDHHHNDPEFSDAIFASINSVNEFSGWELQKLRYFPTRLGFSENDPPNEQDLLQMAATKYIQFSTSGNA